MAPNTNRFTQSLLSVFLLLSVTLVSGRSIAQATDSILVQNHYFPKPVKEEEVYQWRLRASQVRAKLGLPKGRVLEQQPGSGGPYVIWECEYPSSEARQKDVAALDQSEEFKQVRAYMTTLLD